MLHPRPVWGYLGAMRSIASFAPMVLLLACASGGVEGGQDAGGGTPGRDAANVADAAAPEVDAGGGFDGGGHVVLPGPDAGTPDAGTPDAGTSDAGAPDAGAPSQCTGASDGTACDADGDGCTVDDRCMGGSCVPGPREECGGALACGSEMCVSTGPNSFRCELAGGGGGGTCDDGNPCTSGDICGPDGTCAGTPIVDSREPNDTRATARNLGSISDRDSWPYASFTANLYPDGDEDWYRYYVSDDVFGLIYPRVDLTNIPAGSDYDICAYFQCPSGSTSASCESGTSSTVDGLPGCCSRAAGSSNESVRLNPDCSGSDDSGTVYVRVWRHSGAPVCANYTLRWGDD